MNAEEVDMPTPPKSTALATTQPQALAKPTTQRAIIMAEALKEETEQRRLLKEYVREHMVEGVDYGVIPGTDKPALFKPGAEKICDLFRCTTKYEVTDRVQDWDRPLFHYEIKATICNRETGVALAEGLGSCNSHEEKYRYRNARRICPRCQQEAIIEGKAEYGGGFVCFKKKGGCGARFDIDDEVITQQRMGKVENEDVATLVNTFLKMAKKRAQVDAALALGRVSDLFTQDTEDMVPAQAHAPTHRPTPVGPTKDAVIGMMKEVGRTRPDQQRLFVKMTLGHEKRFEEWTLEEKQKVVAAVALEKARAPQGDSGQDEFGLSGDE